MKVDDSNILQRPYCMIINFSFDLLHGNEILVARTYCLMIKLTLTYCMMIKFNFDPLHDDKI